MNAEEIDLRIIVARIEGMLTATLARHDQRLDQHEGTLNQHESRLNEKGKLLARHDERLDDVEEDQAALQADNTARWGRTTGLLALLVAVAGTAFNIFTP